MAQELPLFKRVFTAEDIAEPLGSVAEGENGRMQVYFERKNFDVIGFKEDGEVIGYLEKSKDHDPANMKATMTKFDISDLISKNTDLLECLELLREKSRLFIIDESQVESIITVSDIQKPAVRMLFFGVVTFFENKIANMINQVYPDNSWREFLKEDRFNMAQEIYEELKAKNRETNLINCTQFADKTTIILKSEELLEKYVDLSKTKADKLFGRANSFRDDLAHAQSLAVWFEEKDVIELVDSLLAITEKILDDPRLDIEEDIQV